MLKFLRNLFVRKQNSSPADESLTWVEDLRTPEQAISDTAPLKPPTGSPESSTDTAPLPEITTPDLTIPLSMQTPPGFYVASKTDIGRQRETNQDSYFTAAAYIETNTGAEPFGLFIVADGAGGHHGGEKASDLAARTAASEVLNQLYLPSLDQDETPQAPLNEVLQAAVHKANEMVVTDVAGAASTLTIALMMGRQIYLAHVGDSRAYIFHQGDLHQLTKDHSMTARLIEIGQLAADEAKDHPMRSTLYRAIGQTTRLEVDIYFRELPEDAYLFLCSDGLWGAVPETEISHILDTSIGQDEAVERLIAAANQHGGEDNITAVLISLKDAVQPELF